MKKLIAALALTGLVSVAFADANVTFKGYLGDNNENYAVTYAVYDNDSGKVVGASETATLNDSNNGLAITAKPVKNSESVRVSKVQYTDANGSHTDSNYNEQCYAEGGGILHFSYLGGNTIECSLGGSGLENTANKS